MKHAIPKIAVPRLTVYLRCLEDLPAGVNRISSEELAARAGVNSAKVRKDLSYLGSYGVRGVGYDVEHLRFQIRRELGLTREWPLVIVGVGNLGRALANYGGFRDQGFRVVGIFDDDPNKVGTRVGEFRVEPLEALPGAVRERGAQHRGDRHPARGVAGGGRRARRRRSGRHPQLRPHRGAGAGPRAGAPRGLLHRTAGAGVPPAPGGGG